MILNLIDDVSRFAISWEIRENVFKYDYTQHTNSFVIGSFIGCMARESIGKGEIVRLCYNVLNPTQHVGLENALLSMDEKLCIPLPEVYMAYESGEIFLVNATKRPSMYIRDNIQFFNTWAKMEACINFLLSWRGIRKD